MSAAGFPFFLRASAPLREQEKGFVQRREGAKMGRPL